MIPIYSKRWPIRLLFHRISWFFFLKLRRLYPLAGDSRFITDLANLLILLLKSMLKFLKFGFSLNRPLTVIFGIFVSIGQMDITLLLQHRQISRDCFRVQSDTFFWQL
jgi:hypothetical protein